MIQFGKEDLQAIRHYFVEVCFVILCYVVVILFRQNGELHTRIEKMQTDEINKKEAAAEFWKNAFITTAKYNQYLTTKDTINKVQ